MRTMCLTAGLIGALVTAAPLRAEDLVWAAQPALVSPDTRMMDLVRMSRAELEALYRQADVGTIPSGATRGRAILDPGSRTTALKSRLVHVLWRGKVFEDDSTMINRTAWGRSVRANVYVDSSWLDGRPTLVLDYAGMSRLFGDVRDELREISPGLYLGVTYRCRGPQPELVAFYTIDARHHCKGKH